MTAGAAAARSYAMKVTATSGGLETQVVRHGLSNPLVVAHGRSFADVLTLPRLLFPVCPIAHTAAALRAAEAAAEIDLPNGQTTARDILVLAEAVVGSVWRSALTWPALVGHRSRPEPVREARAAMSKLAESLFSSDWARPGGSEMAPGQAAISEACRQLKRALDSVEDSDTEIIKIATCRNVVFADRCCEVAPRLDCAEETPRSLTYGRGPVRLEDWFVAAHAHGHEMLQKLIGLAESISASPPLPYPSGVTGTGVGQAKTARGRLRHAIALEDGVVREWRSIAPTDQNFAPHGPAAHYARQLRNGPELEAELRWIIAALDPCAPCEIAPVRESAYA